MIKFFVFDKPWEVEFMAANKVVAGGTRRLVFTVLMFAASLFCIFAIAAAIYAFFTPAGIGMRGVFMLLIAGVLAFLAVKFDNARKACRAAN